MASYHLCVRSGQKGKALNHAMYIGREGKYSNGERGADLVVGGHGNMPAWTLGNPLFFWQMADEYERKNGAVYRELELALPRELDRDQHLELIRRFIAVELPGKPYQYAVHETDSALDRGAQPYGHVMYSDRAQDGLSRTPEQFFARANLKHPEKGGCKKDSGGLSPGEIRERLIATRARWAELQNEFLEENGHDSRVDHRRKSRSGVQAERERHFGPARIREMDEAAKERISSRRRE
jgi:hypothetical protein